MPHSMNGAVGNQERARGTRLVLLSSNTIHAQGMYDSE